MTRTEIAATYQLVNGWNPKDFDKTMDELERFTKAIEEIKCKELAAKIERMPFGATAESFAQWVRDQA